MKITPKLTLALMVMIVAVSSLFSFLHMQHYPTPFLERFFHSTGPWMHTMRLFIEATLISFSTLWMVRWSVHGAVRRAASWIKELRLGSNGDPAGSPPKNAMIEPLTKEVQQLATRFVEARAAAESEARLRQAAESLWTPERLKEFTRSQLKGTPLFVVSYREPYQHFRHGRHVECVVPPSGLVTALEPVLRACEGTWIACGNGDADREVVDDHDRVRVPPAQPLYTLRRVWISPGEEKGHYSGFSNEGLWPLCHIAHTRPLFRQQDWEIYKEVNERFALTALEEMEGTEEPWVLIQDYHFALLPRLIKERRPDARVALFWHIPWPNPESFGICPWKRELVEGMLGADLIGFHIQYHCNHFLDTVDQTVECRVNREHSTVNRRGHATWVKPFPISVAFTQDASSAPTSAAPPDKAALLRGLGTQARFFAVGVDRIDYTKGILERFRGVERFLDKYPDYRGQFTFVELAAPSRTTIKRYNDFVTEVDAEAERINARFRTREWSPLVVLKKHHSHRDIEPFYRAADACLVTSLHDGMNLVAKEFVAARDDGDGVLILSNFTGASRELRGCLIVNPYDIDEIAESIRKSLEMDPQERAARMYMMRQIVRERNIYRWASGFIGELARVPTKPMEKVSV